MAETIKTNDLDIMKVQAASCLDGLVNGVMIGSDPLGLAYSFANKDYTKTIGKMGWEDQSREVGKYLDVGADKQSIVYNTSKALGVAAGISLQWYTVGFLQLTYIVANKLIFDLESEKKEVKTKRKAA